jgi:hypothetical protein
MTRKAEIVQSAVTGTTVSHLRGAIQHCHRNPKGYKIIHIEGTCGDCPLEFLAEKQASGHNKETGHRTSIRKEYEKTWGYDEPSEAQEG